MVREHAGRDPEPTAALVDSRSVRAAATGPASSRGYDAGKKVSGRKRHIVVDCLGLLLTAMVTTASVQDRHTAVLLMKRVRDRYEKVVLVWADDGHAGRLVAWARQKLRLTVQIVKRSDEVAGFVVLPRRWCVERTFAWLFRSRRLVRDYGTRPAVHEQMVLWSMTMPMPMSRRPARRRA